MTKAYDDEPRRGPIALEPSTEPFVSRGNVIPPSGPANPRQRVRNDRRSPEPYLDSRVAPDLTGTYFEEKGRYRLFINHAGGHLECLLTLVLQDYGYNKPSKSLKTDQRLPFDWGIAGYLGRPAGRKYNPIAFRFAADHIDGVYMLSVPVWLGDAKIDISATTAGTYDLGFLEALGKGDRIRLDFLGWFVDTWPRVDEHFDVKPGKQLVTDAVRDSRQPVLLDRYLARDSVPYEVRTHYWFPPTPQQRDAMVPMTRELYTLTANVRIDRGYLLDEDGSRGTPMDIYDLVDHGRRLDFMGASTIPRNNIVTAIDHIIHRLFDRALSTPIEDGGLGVNDLPHLTTQVRRLLDAWMLDADGDLGQESLATALQRIVDRAHADHANYSWLERYLDLAPRGWRGFGYEVEITLFNLVDFDDPVHSETYKLGKELFKKIKETIKTNLGEKYGGVDRLNKIMKYLPLSYLVGHMRVRYLGVLHGDASEVEDEEWEAHYAIALGGLQISKSTPGASTSFTMKGSGELWSGSSATAADLQGTMTYLEGAAMAGMDLGQIKGSLSTTLGGGKSLLTLFGSGRAPAVWFVFDAKLSPGSAGASISGRAIMGNAWLLDGGESRIWLEPKEKKEETSFDEYWQNRVASLAVHFPINGARLPEPTESERALMQEQSLISVKEALDAFAACELPLIANPLADIELHGYADAPGEVEKNLELSENRAVSVYNRLRSTLGDRFCSDEDAKACPRVLTVGHGEPAGPRSKSEMFDPTERRAEIKVFVADSETRDKPRPPSPAPQSTESSGEQGAVLILKRKADR